MDTLSGKIKLSNCFCPISEKGSILKGKHLSQSRTKPTVRPVHPPSKSRVLVHPSLDSLEAVEGTCNHQSL